MKYSTNEATVIRHCSQTCRLQCLVPGWDGRPGRNQGAPNRWAVRRIRGTAGPHYSDPGLSRQSRPAHRSASGGGGQK